jgi:hypothetical protein
MNQLYFLGSGRLEWRDIREPTLQDPTDALVRPSPSPRATSTQRCSMATRSLKVHSHSVMKVSAKS